MAIHNLPVKLCDILQSQSEQEIAPQEWRLVGQEQSGSQLLTWSTTDRGKKVTSIGLYAHKNKTFETLYTFCRDINIIQASVNSSLTLLSYVVKTLTTVLCGDDANQAYTPYVVELKSSKNTEPRKLEDALHKQIMVQFLYGKDYNYNPSITQDRLLVFTHLECIKIYPVKLVNSDSDDENEEWKLDGDPTLPDTIVKTFSWAQWDPLQQVLYYIHYRQPPQSFAEGEEQASPSEISPTLSALQFHNNLPHETVLNIPLNLPQFPSSSGEQGTACGQYEDDPVPLRVHDCSLDLHIVCDKSGVVCICHHYLYKPLESSSSSLALDDSVELQSSTVHFAYSITLLHQGCVVHCVVPDLPWFLAKTLRPSFSLYGDNHLLVNIPMLYTQLLDIGLHHEPCCHVVMPNTESQNGMSLASLLGWGPNAMVDLKTLDVLTLSVSEEQLVAAFKCETTVENRMAIIHYLLQHENNADVADELMCWLCVNQKDLVLGGLQRVMEEYLLSHSYAATQRSLPAAAEPLLRLLPFTQHARPVDVKVKEVCVSVTHEKLWNSSVVLLAPRQRVAQFAEDMWTRLWVHLVPPAPRFKCTQVLDKLRVSLDCYQPEALSRCTTPMSPSSSGPMFPSARRCSAQSGDLLPFLQVDVCTASKQEHIISVNLREMSMHLLRNASAAAGSGGGSIVSSNGRGSDAASHVHAAATRWAGAQLEAARALCVATCRAVAATTKHNQQRGFSFIDEMEEDHAFMLFKILETYYLATASLAFPLPQGFTSFFTYLGYRVLPFPSFVQYVHRHVFELQIDVMKAIVTTGDDNCKKIVNNKLRLIQLVGNGRARRALAAWPHKAALLLRARDHAATLLGGHAPGPPVECSHAHTSLKHQAKGLAAFPSGERLSPLDTFLDLLTAKASLNELDFNLIIEATLSVVNE